MKLLIFDLDGTVLNTKKEVTAETRAALNKLGESGVILVPASGRIRGFIPQAVTELCGIGYLISSNGASIYDTAGRKIIYSNSIPLSAIKTALDFLMRQDIYIEVYIDGIPWNMYSDKNEILEKFGIPKSKSFFLNKEIKTAGHFYDVMDESSLIEKINLPYVLPEQSEYIWNELEVMGLFALTSSVKYNMEVNNLTANKGAALMALAEHLKIDREDIMAIGDNGNDIEMLCYAGISVAMGNATSEAAAAAKYRTLSCDEDGVAYAIKKYAAGD